MTLPPTLPDSPKRQKKAPAHSGRKRNAKPKSTAVGKRPQETEPAQSARSSPKKSKRKPKAGGVSRSITQSETVGLSAAPAKGTALVPLFSVVKTPHDPHRHWGYAVVATFLLAMGFGFWGVWILLASDSSATRTELRIQERQINELEQRIATLTRSDQISREANNDLQSTLAERDEEISGLRADVAFYERFVGGTGQRRGLSVHSLQLQPQVGRAWHFTATLTQNLNRGAVNQGRLSITLEGSRAGKLQRLGWTDLRQDPSATGSPYSFKYFQQVEGDVMLPAGLQPLRVLVRLVPSSGSAVEQSFTWAEATRDNAPGA